uniref:Dimer_Tnp_hAT domain-containing protein n=1 Tax=Macrostomum lignano TaxID=282301 RepID=A0A1I8FCN9_9PLAT
MAVGLTGATCNLPQVADQLQSTSSCERMFSSLATLLEKHEQQLRVLKQLADQAKNAAPEAASV